MNHKICCLGLCASLLALPAVCLADFDVDSRTSLKINRAKRHNAMEAQDKDGFGNNGTVRSCNGVEIGNVHAGPNQRNQPRENTVVVTGDVINIPSDRCR